MIESIEKGRQEDGNRSIADKIIKRLNDLDNTVENNQGRWAWELLQNAKDSVADVNTKISIQIELNEDSVEFRHNGIHFTEKDIRGLINQISSKEIEDETESKKTGRFGTGFLTTHLLSKEIEIKGVVKTDDNKFYRFKFPLNREGKTTATLIPKIEKAWSEFHKSVIETSYIHDTENFDTSFTYKLIDEQKEVARIGIEEFVKLIPFVMSSISKIDSVEIIDNTTNKKLLFKNNDNVEGLITSITKIEDGEYSEVLILKYSNDKVSICCGLDKTDKGYAIKDITNLPKLFCDFPLVGTESFHFPIIVNSFYFNPLTERDGIWLKGTNDHAMENKSLLLSALELYQKLIKEISDQDYFKLYNIIETKLPKTNPNYFDENWYKENIQKTLRSYLTSLNIVELENGEKKSIKDLWFPEKSYSENVKNKLWRFTYDLFPHLVCKESDINQWSKKSWSEWKFQNYEELANDISNKKNIGSLSETLDKDNSETYSWLNSLRRFLLELETNKPLFEKYSITPNQNEVLKKKGEIYIDNVKDKQLIEILCLLGIDWKDLLINYKVDFFETYNIKEKKDIAHEITQYINNPRERNESYNKAIILLSEWFEHNNPDEIKDLFPDLYRKKAELFMNTISDKESLYKIMKNTEDLSQLSDVASAIKDNPELLESIQETNQLTNILNEYNLENISQLKEILDASNYNNSLKLDLTQEHLAGLGVTSLEELEKALEDPDLSKMFHESRPNTNAFLYAQKLIARAKQNIINHLKTLKEYDCSDLEELSTTVIGGIKKDGLLMHIVVRPSDNNQVIIYYGSEKDTLDFVNAELWIENGHDKPRCLTLGRILKNTGINKIPV